MLRMTIVSLGLCLALPLAATADQHDGNCTDRLSELMDRIDAQGVGYITDGKVENLLEEARTLCEDGEEALAEEKMTRASELLDAATDDG